MTTTAPGTPWLEIASSTAASIAVSGSNGRSSGVADAADPAVTGRTGSGGAEAGARSRMGRHVASVRTPSAGAHHETRWERAIGAHGSFAFSWNHAARA